MLPPEFDIAGDVWMYVIVVPGMFVGTSSIVDKRYHLMSFEIER